MIEIINGAIYYNGEVIGYAYCASASVNPHMQIIINGRERFTCVKESTIKRIKKALGAK
jgi:hypothetical protein